MARFHLLVDGFEIIHQYSDITIEDLICEEFIAELIDLISKEDEDQISHLKFLL